MFPLFALSRGNANFRIPEYYRIFFDTMFIVVVLRPNSNNVCAKNLASDVWDRFQFSQSAPPEHTREKVNTGINGLFLLL